MKSVASQIEQPTWGIVSRKVLLYVERSIMDQVGEQVEDKVESGIWDMIWNHRG